MMRHILFIQGAGVGAYLADKVLADNLQASLGSGYTVHYPAMPDEENAPHGEWRQRIIDELATIPGPVVCVGHSIGGSVLAKVVSQTKLMQKIAGVLLISAPFWGGDGWRYPGYRKLELVEQHLDIFSQDIPVFLYHCRDDEIVPFAHLTLYAKVLPQAITRPLDHGGHQLDNNLTAVAKDIKSLES